MAVVEGGIAEFLQTNPKFESHSVSLHHIAVCDAIPSRAWQALRLTADKDGKSKFTSHMKSYLHEKGLQRVTLQPPRTGLYNKPPRKLMPLVSGKFQKVLEAMPTVCAIVQKGGRPITNPTWD